MDVGPELVEGPRFPPGLMEDRVELEVRGGEAFGERAGQARLPEPELPTTEIRRTAPFIDPSGVSVAVMDGPSTTKTLMPGQASAIWGVFFAGLAVWVLPYVFGPLGMVLGGIASRGGNGAAAR